jgi:hypothetical protein
MPSDLHTFTPSYRAKPKIGVKERDNSPLSVSFFDWAKNETQKTHPSTALRLALRVRHETNRKGPKGHPVDSPALRAQTTIRLVRGFGFAL